MKIFLTRLLAFLIPLLILAFPLDFIFSYFLKQSNEYAGEYEVWNEIYNSNANCEIAIYGSSRAWVHINPMILEDSLGLNAYNFGIDGHNFWLQYLRYLEHSQYNKKPSIIILSVDVFSLQKRKDLYNLNQFLPYMLWNSNIISYTSSYNGFKKVDYYLPLLRYVGKSNALNLILKNIARIKEKSNYRQNGFKSMNKMWGGDFEKAQKTNQSIEINIDIRIIDLLKKFIVECKAKNIELIFVYTPEYIDGQNFVSNRNDIIQIYRKLSTKYSVPFYDYSKDTLCFDKKYFYNASHLNNIGSETFSKKFANELKLQGYNLKN